MICAGGYCRVECRDDRDCVNGWHCLASGVPDKQVCLPPDAPLLCLYHSDCVPTTCDTGAGCIPTMLCSVDGVCRPHCRASRDCLAYDPRMTCTANVCLLPGEGDGGVRP